MFQAVSKICAELVPPIRTSTEADVEMVLDAVMKLNAEYERQGADGLRPVVAEVLNSYVLQLKMVAPAASTSTPALANSNSILPYGRNSSNKRSIDSGTAANTNGTVEPSTSSSSSSPSSSSSLTSHNREMPPKRAKKSSKANQKQSPTEAELNAATLAHLEAQVEEATAAIWKPSERPTARLDDLAGMDAVVTNIRELVFFPVMYPYLYEELGVQPPCGLLLNGPSGCGKTHLAMAIAGELGVPFYKASGPELIGGTSGESEQMIKNIFESALASAPSVLFIDAIDVIATKREGGGQSRGMDRRIVAQLYDCIDMIASATDRNGDYGHVNKNDSKKKNDDNDTKDHSSGDGITKSQSMGSLSPTTDQEAPINDHNYDKTHNEVEENSIKKSKLVVLIAATSRQESLDLGVRGRFAREISLSVPDAEARCAILKKMSKDMKLADNVDFKEISRITPGYVGADLRTLTREAGMLTVKRAVAVSSYHLVEATTESNVFISAVNHLERGDVLPSSAQVSVNIEDFISASKTVQPTAKREGFAIVPDVSWNDVGALAEVRDELIHNVLEPIAHPERFRSLGLEVPAGVLFFGPPGCGKTLLAKALANQSGANFISVKGPELLNMYVGESESRVRQVFSRARSSAPCVIFFDELDALCPKRGNGGEGGGGNNVSDRVVNQLLTELDGLETRKDVYIIGATNRLELIDDAMLRPGRLGKLLYVPLPSENDRVSILQALTRRVSTDGTVDVEQLGKDVRVDGFSGADLSALVREAGLSVVKEWKADETNDNPSICARHFESAIARVQPSVSATDRKRWSRVHEYIKTGVGATQALKLAWQEPCA